MLQDLTNISTSIEPIDIPHPAINEMLTLSEEDMENPFFKLSVRRIRVQRVLFLTSVVQATLHAFVSLPRL